MRKASGQVCAIQVDLPVPRGPKRKKWPFGGRNYLPIVAIFAAVMATPGQFSNRPIATGRGVRPPAATRRTASRAA